tara:strand:+ start:401 stop:721 length:321 start_codon:yes stop_codon:yes gene_type:complete
MVKKILANGEPCKKCQDVERRLKEANHWAKLDAIVIANENDPKSEGMELAQSYDIGVAPFFIVENEGEIKIYTLFFKFVNEVLKDRSSNSEANKELIENNSDLDFI